MSNSQTQQMKGGYYQALKAAGVPFSKPYRSHTVDELREAYVALTGSDELPVVEQTPAPEPTVLPPAGAGAEEQPSLFDDDKIAEGQRAAAEARARVNQRTEIPQPPPETQQVVIPRGPRNEAEMPGQRLNSKAEDEPLRIDDEGLVWYQEEVTKPAFPKPRGRRVLKYMETGTKTETVKNGEFMETFEVSGDEQSRPAEVKITLPSYQVGIYKDRRFPFRIHIYNSNRGFDLFEVQNYYGGADLVPQEVKRMYVENVLCYDIRTTVRAIQSEYRQLQLAGKVK